MESNASSCNFTINLFAKEMDFLKPAESHWGRFAGVLSTQPHFYGDVIDDKVLEEIVGPNGIWMLVVVIKFPPQRSVWKCGQHFVPYPRETQMSYALVPPLPCLEGEGWIYICIRLNRKQNPTPSIPCYTNLGLPLLWQFCVDFALWLVYVCAYTDLKTNIVIWREIRLPPCSHYYDCLVSNMVVASVSWTEALVQGVENILYIRLVEIPWMTILS
jgi:hypothetical protein